MTEKFFTISEITAYLKDRFDNDDNLKNVWIKGEVSNLREYKLGRQLYLTLKDANSQISCVIFQTSRINFSLKDHMEVIARGKITIYGKRGQYTFQISYLEPAGIGALALAYEELKNKLKAQGFFSTEYKKDIPVFCKKVGVITSPSGAALHDFVATIRQRNKSVQVIILPTTVQGDGAGPSIAKNIELANKYKKLDVLVLTRGGGSPEELWGFNEEIVAKAIFNSKIPIISAVGHEVDYTIADFVADARAATPTAAGVLVSLSSDEYIRHILGLKDKLNQLLINKTKEKKMELADLHFNLKTNMQNLFHKKQQKLTFLIAKLEVLNPMLLAQKGYVLIKKAGKLIKSINEVQVTDQLNLALHDGQIQAEVTNIIK